MTASSIPETITDDALTCRHGFFTRRGGVSSGVYDSLQCGWGARADTVDNIRENRRRAALALEADPERLVSVYQVHSPRCQVVEAETWAPTEAPQADAMASRAPGVTLGVLSADCAPVLFEDTRAGVVAAAHAGWRGALDGVLEATVATMIELGAARERVCAVVGPCIGPQRYEVGPEYVARFVEHDPANRRFFAQRQDGDRALFDLPSYVLARLQAIGVAQARWVGRCTVSEPALFFSNRRALLEGEPDYGRLLSAISTPEAA